MYCFNSSTACQRPGQKPTGLKRRCMASIHIKHHWHIQKIWLLGYVTPHVGYRDTHNSMVIERFGVDGHEVCRSAWACRKLSTLWASTLMAALLYSNARGRSCHPSLHPSRTRSFTNALRVIVLIDVPRTQVLASLKRLSSLPR